MKDSPKQKKTKNKKYFLFLLLPCVLIGMLLLVLFVDKKIAQRVLLQEILPLPLPNFSVASYPVLETAMPPDISAESAIVMDNDTKIILFQKNVFDRHFPASTTKLMTALIGISHFSLNDILQVQNAKVEGSTVGLSYGEKITFKDLLYAMLLPSGNDAAVAIAANYPGGVSAFVSAMNIQAKVYHLSDTQFEDPAGLSDTNNYMSAYDLAKLASIALSNDTIRNIVNTKNTTISSADGTIKYDISNLNKLLGTYGVNGVKTGYTEEAGQVLATSKDEQGHTIIIVVMKSLDRFADTTRLLEYVSGHVTFATILP